MQILHLPFNNPDPAGEYMITPTSNFYFYMYTNTESTFTKEFAQIENIVTIPYGFITLAVHTQWNISFLNHIQLCLILLLSLYI